MDTHVLLQDLTDFLDVLSVELKDYDKANLITLKKTKVRHIRELAAAYSELIPNLVIEIASTLALLEQYNKLQTENGVTQ